MKCNRAGYPKSVRISYGTKDKNKPKKCSVYPITIVRNKSNGILWLFTKQDIEHRVRCPKNRTRTRCKPHIKKLPNVSHNQKVSDTPKKNKRKPNAKKQVGRENSTYHVRGTGIPCNDKRAHARVVSQSAYHLVAKITSFLT